MRQARPVSSWSTVARLVLLGCLFILAKPVAAALGADGGPGSYQVLPGDTLASISEQFGISVRALMRANGLQDPRQLHPGQTLSLASALGLPGTAVALTPHAELLSLSRASGVSPEAVARVNELLLPTRLPTGLSLWLPASLPAAEMAAPIPASPRLATAVHYGLRLADVMWLNPVPGTLGQRLLLPSAALPEGVDEEGESELPYPVETLTLSSQPVARGETAVVTLETSVPIDCTFSYLSVGDVCLPADGSGRAWFAIIGLPALLDPGSLTVTLHLMTADAAEIGVPVSLMVAPGRYDYERLDLPSDRQALLDPQLSQAETSKIAALQTLRTPTRYWTYPFRRPLESAVTSYYGSRRSYGYGFGSYHAGTDFDGEVGMPAIAPSDGVVVLAEPLVVRGNAIVIDHGWGILTGYWHLSRIDVEVGQQVAAGERIGLVGNTGLSTGAHLHWELWVNGVAVDVLSWLEADGPTAALGAIP